ncbi:MAG: hypothetical protein AAB413_05105 [Patescibacteria group bacterium]
MERERIIGNLRQLWGIQNALIKYLDGELSDVNLHGEDPDDQVSDARAIGFIVGRNFEGTPEAMADAFIERFKSE